MAYKYFLQTPYMLNKIVPKSITKIPTFYQKKNDDKMFLEGIRNKSTSIVPIAAKYDRCFFELRTKIKNENTDWIRKKIASVEIVSISKTNCQSSLECCRVTFPDQFPRFPGN